MHYVVKLPISFKIFKENKKIVRIAVIADDYPPKRSSAAIQIKDLAESFVLLNCIPTVIVPGGMSQKKTWMLEHKNEVQILRLRAPETKGIGFFRRTINELMMPFYMIYGFKRSPFSNIKFDGLIWYSPSIFLSLFVGLLKCSSNCRTYLILRDIFPKWAVDLGLLRKNSLPYLFFKKIEAYQFSIANTIGIQSVGNLPYVDVGSKKTNIKIEVLHNWLATTPASSCSISIANSILAGRYIFVYAGNMGVAQGVQILLDLASSLINRSDIGFLFVGRGSYFDTLKEFVFKSHLTNVVIFDEIDASEIPALYAQCHVGMIALDSRHQTHNIPGKFLSYMQSGLPVLAAINNGNDLEDLIELNLVGKVCTNGSVDELRKSAISLVESLKGGSTVGNNCRTLSNRLFSPESAARQIISALSL
jgi:glycosyltransferase involved in cell wall biosynthesis